MTREETVTDYRPELDIAGMPERMRSLRINRGYPVPWFVADLPDGTPEFRAMSGDKWMSAVRQRLCWVCGQKLGSYLSFVLGPMCGINRTTSEPPCHHECAVWSSKNCPFMARPRMVRREGDEIAEQCKENVAGCAIRRNPGVALVWVTKSYEVFDDGRGRPLIHIGEPISMTWFAEGREATRDEVEESVRSGLPILAEAAKSDPRALADLEKRATWLKDWYPRAMLSMLVED